MLSTTQSRKKEKPKRDRNNIIKIIFEGGWLGKVGERMMVAGWWRLGRWCVCVCVCGGGVVSECSKHSARLRTDRAFRCLRKDCRESTFIHDGKAARLCDTADRGWEANIDEMKRLLHRAVTTKKQSYPFHLPLPPPPTPRSSFPTKPTKEKYIFSLHRRALIYFRCVG